MSDSGPLAIRITAVVTGIIVATLAVAYVAGRPAGGALLTHVGLLAVLLVVGRWVSRIRGREARALVAGATAVGAMFFLYGSLGQAPFVAIPWDGDSWVRVWDRALFLGAEPVALVSQWVAHRSWLIEALSFVYASFVPYVYVSVFLSLVGRPARVRSVFVLAFVLLYGASFMGYLFVPARGPVVSMTDVLTAPLDGGFFHALVQRSIDVVGGPHGAFPSLHVGASSLATLVELRHGDVLRGLIYVPLVLLICVATVALRYHYVVDILAGATLAVAALMLAERWARRARSVPEPGDAS